MTKVDYQLRPATHADYQYCHDLTKQNMLTLFSRHWGGWVDDAFRKDFHVEEVTIIQTDEERIGYFSLSDREEEAYLSNIQLSPAVQNQGIGTEIMKTILKENAAKAIRLTTFQDNPAMRLYEKLGFEVTERDGETVYMLKRQVD